MRKIDLNTWNRKEHFEFFNAFDEPFFGIVADVDCTKAFHFCKRNRISFFAYYLHKTMKAVNEIKEFRYRILNNEVVCFDSIHASSTIGRTDHTFAATFIAYNSNFNLFSESVKKEINEVNNSTGIRLDEKAKRLDVIHFSPVPWIKFTGLSHPRNLKFKDSVPKINVGKYENKDGKLIMPVSIHAHHGLMDAYHVGQFLMLFQEMLNEKLNDLV